MVRSPKSGVNFFSLGDFDLQFEAAYQRATPAMRQVSRPWLSPKELKEHSCNKAELVRCVVSSATSTQMQQPFSYLGFHHTRLNETTNLSPAMMTI